MDNTAIVSVQEQKQLQLLNNGLITADRFINKNYLINISEQNIVPLDDYEKTTNSIPVSYTHLTLPTKLEV